MPIDQETFYYLRTPLSANQVAMPTATATAARQDTLTERVRSSAMRVFSVLPLVGMFGGMITCFASAGVYFNIQGCNEMFDLDPLNAGRVALGSFVVTAVSSVAAYLNRG